MKEREKFGSRLGFILVSAGCAVGLGNVWKFPYVCGKNGGAIFILIYLAFLIVMGYPIMVSEFSVGRASRSSCATSFKVLEKEGTHWHNYGYFGMLGNYMLMMFWAVIAIIAAFVICSFGVQKGVEKITKIMMVCLLLLIAVLAIHSLTLKGAMKGVRFYLVPNVDNIKDVGIVNVVFEAMKQAFFTLSIGIGAMAIFGSYIDKDRSLSGESVSIIAIDTFVALMAGLIIIPACFAYNIEPGQGPSLIFIKLPTVFNQMALGKLWSILFFVFMSFAAMSTVIAVFENIISFAMDLFNISRKKAVAINIVLITLLSAPCAFGFNKLDFIQLIGKGTTIMDFEDFIVSSNLLPIGSLIYILFCVCKNGFGWDNFIKEADEGEGMKFPSNKVVKFYMTYILPVLIIAIYLIGYYGTFSEQGKTTLGIWMCVAVIPLLFVLWLVLGKGKDNRQ